MTQGNSTVRDLAYRLWEEAGRPEGRDQEFWYAAEARLGLPASPPEPLAPPVDAPAAKAPARRASKPQDPAAPKAPAKPRGRKPKA